MKKIAIIGAGNVGAHIASALIHKNLPTQIYLLDLEQGFEDAQVLDLKDTLLFSPRAHIDGVDFGDAELADCDIFIITAGAKQKPGETRCDLLTRNSVILNNIRQSLAKLSPQAIIILVTNPVDILTRLAVDIFDLPKGQIFGSGTLLDSARLRWRLAEKLDRPIDHIDGWVLGEHGDSEFVAWSSVSDADTLTEDQREQIQHSTMREAYEIISGKGATWFGIGAAVGQILQSILLDEKTILPVSTLLQGEYNIHDVALGIPCVIGKKGIEKIVDLPLNNDEQAKLQASAKKLRTLFAECPT